MSYIYLHSYMNINKQSTSSYDIKFFSMDLKIIWLHLKLFNLEKNTEQNILMG